ncbi:MULTISPECIES: NAD(P)/FAD-dependent oxidoreductase [Pseudomonas]|jgi:NADH dehydrogenase|uniref:FAD-dependent pyridine nucleotide-disulfide oxidoreductase n=4 Tax=Pseudomonas fluorescens group TaxID=136843 RepID=A0A024EJP5_9PSED|nr:MULTISPECIES: NAD(P)/FAD-dependent oxidoreductase [Pseudomonas]MBA4360993.1 NAD(P)/FAD-dependent oxidoreductase [Pseudomonas sp.]AHZ72811.1 FAD-dependent pyridine nucleotide-disulfide oxidoreductase [Pseudomonas mandelii JR-1]OYP99345.1 NADH dehydrogenase family protein [Pseudomonas mandelii]TWC27771.1 NADH dehydrogenase [Pseudomonas sp. SJZ083]TWC53889.1 NADH dehydrogenase [Pseudomonas sp. SJZ077]
MKQNILVIGAGFGGVWSALSAARLLDKHDRKDVQITVLAPQAELRIRPRFYEADVHTMMAPLGDLFDAVGVKFVKGSADHIDVENKQVAYSDVFGTQGTLSYDRLVLAAGSRVIRPALEGMIEHAFDVDQIEEASRLEAHIKSLKNLPYSTARNTVVVAGGGFTGIETATEMPARLRAALGSDASIRVIVVDRGPQIAASMGDGIRPSIIEASNHLGIEWVLNSSVASVDAGGVTLADGQRIESNTVIWTVGFRASPLTEQVVGTRDPQGRLHVDGNLKVLGHADVFAAGDVAYAATDTLGNFAGMSCQHAISLGRYAGNNVAADLLGVEPITYSQPKYVTCLDLGAWGAVFTEGWDRQLKLVGHEAKELKTQINTVWIYPPAADRATALAAADPLIPVA